MPLTTVYLNLYTAEHSFSEQEKFKLGAYVIKHPDKDIWLTLGDIHANANKLAMLLFAYGFIDENSLDPLKQLIKSYNGYKSSPIETVTQYAALLKQIKLVNKYNLKLRFIGDILADRGHNDIFIFLWLEKLNTENIEYAILMSNHDLIFIHSFIFGRVPDSVNPLLYPWLSKNFKVQSNSLYEFNNLHNTMGATALLALFNMKYDSLQAALNHFYFPYLLLLDYQTEDSPGTRPVVYTHAPSSTEHIGDVYRALISRSSTTRATIQSEKAMAYVKKVNASFFNIFVKPALKKRAIPPKFFQEKSPLHEFFWRRDISNYTENDRQFNWCFGHVGPLPTPKKINCNLNQHREEPAEFVHLAFANSLYNIDNSYVGKTEGDYQGLVPSFIHASASSVAPRADDNTNDENTPLLGEKKRGCCIVS